MGKRVLLSLVHFLIVNLNISKIYTMHYLRLRMKYIKGKALSYLVHTQLFNTCFLI
ncbi:hypothetical protein SBF1_5490003 [Candidatus Desulfosporosinus infrequens]|uniref:Uncharacterized protein n=1 Tax=Candidatus Desulfosporosinus infrequens TaxID=2043169 RepID=A0A2U3LJD3_9FIRM|nr:hypothetical protein SBF1_5490003 [Candidatus Desulfosporosinus infrequens]